MGAMFFLSFALSLMLFTVRELGLRILGRDTNIMIRSEYAADDVMYVRPKPCGGQHKRTRKRLTR